MAPIGVALIGLSQSAKTSWASEAHLPYLLSERGRQRYRIVAVLNSSVDAARAAIQYYDLPQTTKAYGAPQDVANDADVELVVCTTRVDVHYGTVRPSVEAGKAVFAEWPLAENQTRASELAELARRSGSPTMVGLQARVAPSIVKIRDILSSGELGRVLSSSVQAFTPWSPRDSVSAPLAYFLDKKVGGNPITIAFGHMIDGIHSVLGEYESSHGHAQIQRPEQYAVDRDTDSRTPHVSDVPDLVTLHGTLKESPSIRKGATLAVYFRRGPTFPDTKPFVWTINCEKGELRLWSDIGPSMHSESQSNAFHIDIHDFSSDTVRTLETTWAEEWRIALSPRARNIGKLYDLYAEGEYNDLPCANFEAAVLRHKQLDAMLYAE